MNPPTPALPGRRRSLKWLGALAVPGAASGWIAPAHAVVYLERDQALRLLAPSGASVEAQPLPLSLDDESLRRIAEASGTRVPRGFSPACFVARTGGACAGWICFDQVIGKHELIDYAVGFDVAGAVTRIEILVYRESHGAQIRNAAWRAQFAGRAGPAALRFGEDMRNVTGATLSCQHVTEGVRRLSALVNLVVARQDAR